MKNILLTIDLEEFDLPREYNQIISDEEMYEISKKGLDNLLKILDKYNLKATFFTTANFAKKFPGVLKELSKKHEIASHSYSHSEPLTLETIKKAKVMKEKIIGKNINGFRAPRWNIQKIKELEKAGFDYDSSTHPIFLPGRYMNIKQKRYVHKIGNITEIPLSTLPIVNLSIFWLAFKNFPLIYSKFFTKINFVSRNYTMLVFHPWEFTDISKYKISFYIKKNPKNQLKKLEKYILFCRKNHYWFDTISDYLNTKKIKK